MARARARALVLLAHAAVLAGCATPQTDALRHAPLAHGVLQGAHDIPAVPFFAQDDHQCGPATLAMALDATGLNLSPADLRASVFLPDRQGALAPEMLATARRHGRLAVRLAPRLEAVLREIDAGHPVIVLQNLGLSAVPIWHYALVTGYDLALDRLTLHSGPDPLARMSLEVFERTWQRGGYWAMVTVAPPELPASVPETELVEAAADLERSDVRAARAAYGALVQRFAANYGAWMGLGNSAYALGDAAAAAAAFTTATTLAPERGDAWNNLATALLALGDLDRARSAVARALTLGGPQHATYEQTAAEIAHARRDTP